MHSAPRGWFLAAILILGACGGPPLDISKAVQVTNLTTGWFDAGVENGLNKLIPTVSFRLKNATVIPLRNIQLNAVYRRVGETEEWGAAYTRVVAGEGLAPGATSPQIMLKSNLGYTSTDPRSQMLRHSQFKDAHVKVFAKQGSAQYVLLGEWDIQRVLMVTTSTQ